MFELIPFEVIPAVDLKDFKCVQLQQGRAERVLVSISDPVKVAVGWMERGAKTLHVVDLSGAFGGNLYHEKIIFEIVKEAKSRDVTIQVGGGIRSAEIAVNLLEKGVDRVILGTLAFENPDVVKALAKKYPERIVVAVDSKEGKVVVKGWKEKTNLSPAEFASIYEGYDILLLYTNVDVEGLMKGVSLRSIRDVVESVNFPVYVAGGISSIDDVLNIKKVGAKGVIIGSALYTGKIVFEELLNKLNKI